MTENILSRPVLSDHVCRLLLDSIATKQRMLETQVSTIVEMAIAIADALQRGGKVMFCGNGGSAADAQHLAAELLVRLRPQVNRPAIAALAMAGDTSSLTACGNDYSFDLYYARMVEALGKPGDVLVGITTSGRSANVVQALHKAKAHGLVTLGLLGGDGLPALEACDLALIVPSSVTGRVQESHITAGHAMLELVEDLLLAGQGHSEYQQSNA